MFPANMNDKLMSLLILILDYLSFVRTDNMKDGEYLLHLSRYFNLIYYKHSNANGLRISNHGTRTLTKNSELTINTISEEN